MGRLALGERKRLLRIARFADHDEVAHGFEARAQTVAYERMIVDEKQARDGGGCIVHGEMSCKGDNGASDVWSGTRAVTTVWPACEASDSVPPSASSRSRILRSPKPERLPTKACVTSKPRPLSATVSVTVSCEISSARAALDACA